MRRGFGIRTRLRRWRHGPLVDGEYLEARVVTSLLRQPPAPLTSGDPDPDALHAAFVVPFFRHGSGGHTTIANLIRGLEARGHRCSVWIDDPGHRCVGGPLQSVRDFRLWFGPFAAEVRYGFDAWRGADVVVATGWQTVARVRLLSAVARAYLVQDHEPEFFATSAQRHWAEDSYRHGLYPITAGRWLAEVMEERYGLPATSFDLGVDSSLYRPQDLRRRDDVVLFYARSSTPRRATPLAYVALAELKHRLPEMEVWFFGDGNRAAVDFPFRHLGVVKGRELAELYGTATVGLVLSMTNYSLVPQEMLACGLPCVELESPSTVAAFGSDGPVDLAPFDPRAIADTLERLLRDPRLRTERAEAGARLAAQRTWDAAARQCELGLRAALGTMTAR